MTMPTTSPDLPPSTDDVAGTLAELNEIQRVRDLAGPPAWATAIADQLSTLIGIAQIMQSAIEEQTRQIATLVSTVGEVQALGASLPPDMLANLGKMFGG